MTKLTIKITEVKPSPEWTVGKEKAILLSMGAGLQKKCAAQKPPVDVKAVKCTVKSPGLIEYEWTGPADANDVKKVIKL